MLVAPDDQISEVAKEVVVVVEIRKTACPHVRGRQVATLATSAAPTDSGPTTTADAAVTDADAGGTPDAAEDAPNDG